MIPRYHPQITPWDILCAICDSSNEVLSFPELEQELKQGKDRFFWLNGATAGLYLILKALGLPPGSGVAVPVYSCVAVFEAVTAAGLNCVFVDIDPQTFSFDLESLYRKREEISATIMIHTFGFPGDIDAVRGVLKYQPIVEDCSHALGSSYSNKPVGLCGVAGVFSFNYQKPLSAGGGGLLIVNDERLVSSVQNILLYKHKPKQEIWIKSVVSHFLKTMLYRRPWYGLLVSTGILNLHRHGILSIKVDIGSMPQFNRSLLKRNYKRLHHRWENQRTWARQISELSGNPLPVYRFVSAGESWNGYLCPILLTTPEKRETSLRFFHSNKIDAFVLWSECLYTAARFGYRPGMCPLFEDAFKRLLLLPCYAELTDRQQKHIRKVVETWRLSL